MRKLIVLGLIGVTAMAGLWGSDEPKVPKCLDKTVLQTVDDVTMKIYSAIDTVPNALKNISRKEALDYNKACKTYVNLPSKQRNKLLEKDTRFLNCWMNNKYIGVLANIHVDRDSVTTVSSTNRSRVCNAQAVAKYADWYNGTVYKVQFPINYTITVTDSGKTMVNVSYGNY